MWPKVPENFTALSIDELTAWRSEVRAALIAARSASPAKGTPERDEIDTYDAHYAKAGLVLADKKATEAYESETDTDPKPEDVPPVEPGDGGDGGTGDEEPDPDASAPRTVLTTVGASTVPSPQPGPGGRVTPKFLRAAESFGSKKAGDAFDSWAEYAECAIKKAEKISPQTNEKHVFAKLVADYPAERRLGENFALNMAKFEHDELMAALCAPATPYYGLACMNATRRPVFNSLTGFEAPRGKVTVMSSPSLSDITTGVGLWTAADDADSNAVKETCQTITCNDPSTYTVYAVYRCMTVKNLLWKTYPELVEAWLNRLWAAQSRLAEQQLLAQIYAGTTEIQQEKLGYGATTTLTRTILQYIALYQETQRWDTEGDGLQMWAPRWLRTAIKMDLVSRRSTSGAPFRVPSNADVDAIFNDMGISPTWAIDTPSYATSLPAVSSNGLLNRLPSEVEIIVAPRGKFALMDLGGVEMGVTANNVYRDNTSNSRNEFTFFFEGYEGVVNTNSCPAHTLVVPICANGVQVDDQLVDCLGRDMGTYQS